MDSIQFQRNRGRTALEECDGALDAAARSARGLIESSRQPPVQLAELMETSLPSGEVRTVVDELLRLKSLSAETESV